MAITLALSLVPLSFMAVGAVDLTRAVSVRGQLQDALDAAALSAARTAPAKNPTLLQSAGVTAFQRNIRGDDFSEPAVSVGTPTFVYAKDGSIVGDVQARVDTLILGLFTGDTIPVSAHSEVVSANLKLEIALVLDNSGSMAQNNKIGDLRIAASNFVDTMDAAERQWGDPTAVQISLVPFSQTVRVDPVANAKAKWLDTKGEAPISQEIFADAGGKAQKVNRLDLFKKVGTSWAGCLESRAYPYDVTDAAPVGANKATLYTPYFWPDEYDGQTGYYTPNNYLTDGLSNVAWKTAERYVGKYAKTYGLSSSHGPNKDCTMQPIRPLGTDFAGLKSAIGQMQPTNDTNIPMALHWGWQTLSPTGPLKPTSGIPVSAYNDRLHQKIAVVMTDGYNQYTGVEDPSRNITGYEGVGYVWQGRLSNPDGSPLTAGSDASRSAALDRRLSELCANMKAKGIEIYTVSVGVAPEHLEPLRSCASGADHAYDVANGAQLIDAFGTIARQIANLHLSR